MQFFIYSSISEDLSFSGSSAGKESSWNSGDPSSIPWSGRSLGERIGYPLQHSCASLVSQMVKNPSAMRETWVRSLGWEDPLEEVMATPVFLPGESPWTKEPGGLQSVGLQRVRYDWACMHTHTHTHTHTRIYIIESLCNTAEINTLLQTKYTASK